MAQTTGTHSSYDATGNYDDLADVVYKVWADETPGLSRIKRNKATATYHEWVRSVLASSGTNYVIEGDEATADTLVSRTRAGNYTCISDKVPIVTGTQEAVSKAGVDSEMAYQLEKLMKELKTDVEKMIWDNNARVAGNDTTAREAAGMPSWLISNVDKASDATLATGDGTDAFTTGTARALTENLVESCLASVYASGGNPTWGTLGTWQKRKFAAFTANTTRTQEQNKSGKLVNTVDVYTDPLGFTVQLVPNRHSVTSMIFFVDPDYTRISILRDFRSWDLAKLGDHFRKQLLAEWTLEVSSEKAHGMITDLSTS